MIPSHIPAIDPSRLGPPAGARIAVVGGCGGMGRVLVQALLDTGVQVAVLDLPQSMTAYPPPAGTLSFPVDASNEAGVTKVFAALQEKWPALDGFVNFVGFLKGHARARDLSSEVFDEVASGNLRAHFLCAKAALPLLHAAKHGAMVLVSSTLGVNVTPGYLPYSVAKAGIIAMTKGLARENAPKVRVNAIAPGLTDTAFLHGGTGRDQAKGPLDPATYAQRVPMQRIAEAEDMMGPILFMLGAASRHVTGETLIVDGGVYVQ